MRASCTSGGPVNAQRCDRSIFFYVDFFGRNRSELTKNTIIQKVSKVKGYGRYANRTTQSSRHVFHMRTIIYRSKTFTTTGIFLLFLFHCTTLLKMRLVKPSAKASLTTRNIEHFTTYSPRNQSVGKSWSFACETDLRVAMSRRPEEETSQPTERKANNDDDD